MSEEAKIGILHQELQPYLSTYGHRSDFFSIDGVDIHCVNCGSGPPVLLIHGFGSSLYTWRHIIKDLASEHEVHAIDLPGFGLSDAPRRFRNGLTGQADFLAKVIEAMRLGPVRIIAHSLGGAVSMELCQRYPHLVWSIVLISSSQPGLLNTPPRAMKNLLLFTYYNKQLITHDVLKVAELINRIAQPDNLEDMLHDTRFDDNTMIGTRAAIIWGMEDQVISPRTSNDIAKCFNSSKLYLIGKCGHAPHEESPYEVLDLLISFLQNKSG